MTEILRKFYTFIEVFNEVWFFAAKILGFWRQSGNNGEREGVCSGERLRVFASMQMVEV